MRLGSRAEGGERTKGKGKRKETKEKRMVRGKEGVRDLSRLDWMGGPRGISDRCGGVTLDSWCPTGDGVYLGHISSVCQLR